MTPAVTATSGDNMAPKVRALRITALAGLVMLLLEYGLGIWTSLYAHLPASDHGKATSAAFGGAFEPRGDLPVDQRPTMGPDGDLNS